MDFNTAYKEYVTIIESELDRLVPEKESPEGVIFKAMRYSLLSGGKHIRPVLSLAVGDMLGANRSAVLGFACAIEMIHAYSLIHDDLPAMDNSDYRRGRLSSHKVFGEAMAILAGDSLLSKAFEVMVQTIGKIQCDLNEADSEAQCGDGAKTWSVAGAIAAMELVARSSGADGMVGGQVIDISGVSSRSERMVNSNDGTGVAEDLDYLHGMKTGAMFKAAVLSPALIIGLNEQRLLFLSLYASKIGLAFQIMDDLLDVVGEFDTTGKIAGTDSQNCRDTYVSLLGQVESRRILSVLVKEASDLLEPFGMKAAFLKTLATYIADRSA